MNLVAALAIVLPAAVSYGALRRIWSRDGVPAGRLLALAVAPGLGLGLASCLYFLLLLVTAHRVAMPLDATVWLAAAGWLAFDWNRRAKTTLETSPCGVTAAFSREWKPALVACALGCLVLVLIAIAGAWMRLTVLPLGESDGVAIWNLRARSIVRAAPDWAIVLSPVIGWSHPDYPLLVPISIARIWSYAGNENAAMARLIAMLFFVSSVATVGLLVGRLRGPTAGFLSCVALVGARTFVFQVSCQCGDVPIAFYILVTVTSVLLAREARDPAALLWTGGVSAGLAAWTKNEGLLVLIVIGVFVLISFPNRRLRALWLASTGAAFPLATVLIFKLGLSPTNGIFAGQTREIIAAKLADPARWTAVATQVWDLLGRWGGIPGGALIGLAAAVVLAEGADSRSVLRSISGLSIVTALLFGYAIVYVITPYPQTWHVGTSFERLIVQLWPSTVFAAFQLTGTARVGRAPQSG